MSFRDRVRAGMHRPTLHAGTHAERGVLYDRRAGVFTTFLCGSEPLETIKAHEQSGYKHTSTPATQTQKKGIASHARGLARHSTPMCDRRCPQIFCGIVFTRSPFTAGSPPPLSPAIIHKKSHVLSTHQIECSAGNHLTKHSADDA